MKHLLLICLIFNGNMVFFTRNSRFLTFLSAYNDLALRMKLKIINPIFDTLLPTLEDNWLLGLTDAEGCFNLSLLSNSKAYRLRFIISQKWDVNTIILQHISSILKVGDVSHHSLPNNWNYIVNGVKNTANIIPYFETHLLLSKKKESYNLWKQLRLQLINGDHLNDLSRVEMVKICKYINK
uniref:LAGLIDADG homing endonuclease n=1 Tax=Myochromella boudieri TaxID=117066 RepID=A0A386TY59_9AGAR|nr:LAGLIDADG homing endonuclease [Myochromella boudieri]AYE93149.1 LAGLIDADG homing endonuclease [Myochromella boudieri]